MSAVYGYWNYDHGPYDAKFMAKAVSFVHRKNKRAKNWTLWDTTQQAQNSW